MQRTNLEDELSKCLEGHQVSNSNELAENFIESGFTCDDMNDFAGLVPPAYLSPVLTGLGLDVVSKIVKQHGGSIKVNSVVGRTAFIIYFPIDGN